MVRRRSAASCSTSCARRAVASPCCCCPNSTSYSSLVGFPVTSLPDDLRGLLRTGESGLQRFSLNGDPYLAVGVYIEALKAQYIEAFPLRETDRSLRTIATVLGIGSAVITLLAAGLGWWTSRRLLRPLTRVAMAAGEIAGGGLDARMAPETDPRPRPAGPLVQRDGRRCAGPHRARGALRQRRVPRAALPPSPRSAPRSRCSTRAATTCPTAAAKRSTSSSARSVASIRWSSTSSSCRASTPGPPSCTARTSISSS